jgi:hypothetical protein
MTTAPPQPDRRLHAEGDEIDELAGAFVTFGLWLKDHKDDALVFRYGHDVSYALPSRAAVEAKAAEFGVKVTETPALYKATVSFGPRFTYTVWAPKRIGVTP